MLARLKIALAVVISAFLLAAGALVWLTVEADSSGSSSSSEFAGAVRPSSLPLVDFKLQDQSGEQVDMSKLRGQTVIVTFLYTTCEDECPTVTQQIRGALDQLGQEFPVVAVSVDPKNDTAKRAKQFITRQHMSGRMQFAVGKKQQLEPIWNIFGIAPQTDDAEHSAHVVLVDWQGKQRIGFPLDKLTPESLANDIQLLEQERLGSSVKKPTKQ